ncbi:MAG: Type 1 glutamine amidotransferase-like domain-containing protein [bacterium]
MRLILGSDLTFLLKYGYELTGIPKDQMKIGYVTTASKGTRTDFVHGLKTKIREAGYYIEEIDIECKNKEDILEFFKDKNIIHVEGGNTFYLLKAIRGSRFEEALKELLYLGKVYIGTSAGSYIMCPTIEISDWNDATVDRFGVTDFTALNYVPFLIKAHYKEEQEEMVREKNKLLKYPLHLFKDGQGCLVEDGNYKFYGDVEEVKLI